MCAPCTSGCRNRQCSRLFPHGRISTRHVVSQTTIQRGEPWRGASWRTCSGFLGREGRVHRDPLCGRADNCMQVGDPMHAHPVQHACSTPSFSRDARFRRRRPPRGVGKWQLQPSGSAMNEGDLDSFYHSVNSIGQALEPMISTQRHRWSDSVWSSRCRGRLLRRSAAQSARSTCGPPRQTCRGEIEFCHHTAMCAARRARAQRRGGRPRTKVVGVCKLIGSPSKTYRAPIGHT